MAIKEYLCTLEDIRADMKALKADMDERGATITGGMGEYVKVAIDEDDAVLLESSSFFKSVSPNRQVFPA